MELREGERERDGGRREGKYIRCDICAQVDTLAPHKPYLIFSLSPPGQVGVCACVGGCWCVFGWPVMAAVISIMRGVIRVTDTAAVITGAVTQDNEDQKVGGMFSLFTHTHTHTQEGERRPPWESRNVRKQTPWSVGRR